MLLYFGKVPVVVVSSADAASKVLDFELIPFGAIAVNELVLANLVFQFDWKLADGVAGEDLDMFEAFGLTCHRKYPLIAIATKYEKNEPTWK